jgi:hypothetical protein
VRTLAWIVVLTMVGAAPLAGCGADREEDEQQNLAILHELPTFPGARELEVGTAPYYGHEEGPFDGAEGHTTSITYRAPGGTTQRELIRFYTSRLEKGWGCEIERSGEIDITDGQHPRRRGVYLQLRRSSDTAHLGQPRQRDEENIEFRRGRRLATARARPARRCAPCSPRPSRPLRIGTKRDRRDLRPSPVDRRASRSATTTRPQRTICECGVRRGTDDRNPTPTRARGGWRAGRLELVRGGSARRMG